ncbi:hypothetical protein SARC_16497 [Sphaeroforma arctica JP610]|uniref:Uncharacterized protein n=1 Tax=Sphaeroforma arctica JP610 TaxID=667725 RepID=A0A0L0F2M1_9EUKA|nr:hypothetical protein SARC_16497 [Sphaeroforma arctica JP610]KNC70970.1 hypothetical protein SARC_16497 [Sphaeroforma arctica JP610]|eukprot:XP_014144872.1 hypothetical protein SARC_16497 [Sphaeroforma arctica JP610]
MLLRRKKATDAIEESRLKMEQLQKDDQDTREMMHRDMPDLLEEVQMLEGWKNRGVKDMYRELSNILLNQVGGWVGVWVWVWVWVLFTIR